MLMRKIIDIDEKRLYKILQLKCKYGIKTEKESSLEPMNPFERRIVHTTLSQRDDVITKVRVRACISRYVLFIEDKIGN